MLAMISLARTLSEGISTNWLTSEVSLLRSDEVLVLEKYGPKVLQCWELYSVSEVAKKRFAASVTFERNCLTGYWMSCLPFKRSW